MADRKIEATEAVVEDEAGVSEAHRTKPKDERPNAKGQTPKNPGDSRLRVRARSRSLQERAGNTIARTRIY